MRYTGYLDCLVFFFFLIISEIIINYSLGNNPLKYCLSHNIGIRQRTVFRHPYGKIILITIDTVYMMRCRRRRGRGHNTISLECTLKTILSRKFDYNYYYSSKTVYCVPKSFRYNFLFFVFIYLLFFIVWKHAHENVLYYNTA